MIRGITGSGFEFNIPDGMDKDFRFIKAYKKIKSGDEDQALEGAIDLVSAVFANEEEEERFYKHLASQHEGRVPSDILYQELNEIVELAAKKDESVKN